MIHVKDEGESVRDIYSYFKKIHKRDISLTLGIISAVFALGVPGSFMAYGFGRGKNLVQLIEDTSLASLLYVGVTTLSNAIVSYFCFREAYRINRDLLE